jgi:hypothetical protein
MMILLNADGIRMTDPPGRDPNVKTVGMKPSGGAYSRWIFDEGQDS